MMLKALGSIAKAAVGVVTLPVDMAADVVNEIGAMGDFRAPGQSHTKRKAKAIMRNLHDATD